MSNIYVIGHVNPDTDAIASAMGYAWFLREKDGINALAARAGSINPQTTWLLKRLGIEPPLLLTDASPRFQSVMKRLNTVSPESPLREAWAITSRTDGVAPVINQDGTPLGLITGLSLLNFFSELVGLHPSRQELRITDILASPCKDACDSLVPRFQASTRIRDVIHRILREEHNDFLVIDEKGYYLGVCHQRDVLNPPRLRIILVDHNEPGQALSALEEAELVEILDHHRLGNQSTYLPIRFSVDVVGSTSTLVSEHIDEAGLSAPPHLASLLLAGLLSDTLLLNSPTTSDRDRRAAERLSRWGFAPSSPLSGETLESFGKQLLAAGTGLATRSPEEVISSDQKQYVAGGYKFAIAQVEVANLQELEEHQPALLQELDELRQRRGLDFSMLMVTDVVKKTSRLLLVNAPPLLEDLPYRRLESNSYLADGLVSRKKQLLPVVLSLLEK